MADTLTDLWLPWAFFWLLFPPSSSYIISSLGMRTRLSGIVAITFSRLMGYMGTGGSFPGTVFHMIFLPIHHLPLLFMLDLEIPNNPEVGPLPYCTRRSEDRVKAGVGEVLPVHINSGSVDHWDYTRTCKWRQSSNFKLWVSPYDDHRGWPKDVVVQFPGNFLVHTGTWLPICRDFICNVRGTACKTALVSDTNCKFQGPQDHSYFP